MKTLKWLVPLAVLALVLSVGTLGAGASVGEPVGAPYVDNQVHNIPADSSVWYRFQYAGDHSQMTIRLVGAEDKGLAFQVYTPAQIVDWWDHDGIGAGSPKDNDLVWTGNAPEPGTWWIKVMNERAAPATFELVVSGKGVSFAEPPVITAPIQSASVTLPVNALPTSAFIVDTSTQLVPAKTTLWYRFSYDGERDQLIIKVPNGAENRLRVHVHTPTQMTTWWDVLPIGQLTAQDNDLVWSGNSNEAGWWYLEVMNDNNYPIGFTILLQSPGLRTGPR